MKKLIIAAFMLFSFTLCCNTAFAAEEPQIEFVLPTGGVSPHKILDPVKLDDDTLLDAAESSVRLFESESYDWLQNYNKPSYTYVKDTYGDSYAVFYQRAYNKLYTFATDYSARTLKYEDEYYLLVNTEDLNDSSFDLSIALNMVIAITDENPQFYFISGASRTFYSDSLQYVGIKIDDDYISGTARQAENLVLDTVIASYDAAVDGLTSNYTIEKAVHDKMIRENDYEYDSNGKPSNEHYAHSVLGILDPKYSGAVCEGYAKSMLMLMNRYDISAYYLAGTVNGGGHAWNAIQLDDGEYHCVDTTWDDGTLNVHHTDGTVTKEHMLNYKYFNTPYTYFYSTFHTRTNSYLKYPDIVPALSENTTYYNENYINGTGVKYTIDASGTYIYTAPTVTADPQKIAAVHTDITVDDNNSYPGFDGSYTASSKLADITSDTLDVIEETSDWSIASINSYKAACTSADSAAVSFVTNEKCSLHFTTYCTGGSATVFIDGIKVLNFTANSSYVYPRTISVPDGRHKVTVQYTAGDSGRLYIFNVYAEYLGDFNGDGSRDMLDAISLAKISELSASAFNNAEYTKYDLNGDSIIDDADIAVLLKLIAKA